MSEPKSTPQQIWGNQVNLAGLLAKKPKRYIWEPDLGSWWFNGDFKIKKLGLDDSLEGIVTFASTSKAEVKAWTEGVKAAHAIIRQLVK